MKQHSTLFSLTAAATLAAVAGWSTPADAVPIVLSQYTFPSADAAGLAATTEATGVTATDVTSNGSGTGDVLGRTFGTNASNLTSSTGVTVTGSAVFANGTGSGNVVRKAYDTSSPSLGDSRHLEFTLTPDGSNTLSLSSITLDAAKGGSSNDRTFLLGYSTDGFTTSASLGGAIFGSTPGAWAFGNFSFDLTGVTALQNTTNTVTFRLFGDVPATENQIGYDNITINGTVVPEPASLALLGLGGLCMLGGRRRK